MCGDHKVAKTPARMRHPGASPARLLVVGVQWTGMSTFPINAITPRIPPLPYHPKLMYRARI